MATATTKLALRKPNPDPATGDDVDTEADLNENWDKVDAAVGMFICTSGTRPASPYAGQVIFETNTTNAYFWNGTGWKRIFIETQSSAWPDTIIGISASNGDGLLYGRATADTFYRYAVLKNGLMGWGSGSGATDVNLYRGAASQLKTDSSFLSLGSVSGTQFIPTIANGYTYSQTIQITASATFTKATYPGLRAIRIFCQGAGGGGGGTGATAAGQSAVGASGGSGALAIKFALAASLATSETVTIGAAGTAGTSGGGTGGTGGTTSFGTLCVAGGGAGGEGDVSNSSSVCTSGGTSGIATAGDILRRGTDGNPGYHAAAVGAIAMGAPSAFGGGGRVSVANGGGAGAAPSASSDSYGGGGAGAWASPSQAAFAGGAGMQGKIEIEIYI